MHRRVSPIVAVLLVVLTKFAPVQGSQIRKCCPSGHRIVQLPEGEEDGLFSHNFRCKPDEEAPSAMFEFGYNLIDVNESNGIPECSNIVVMILDPVVNVVAIEGCVDQMDGTVIELHCADNEKQIELHRLMKCCPKGWSYDLTERKCSANNRDLLVFQHLAGESVVLFEIGAPQCNDGQQVFVEYLSGHHHQLRLHESAVDVVSVHHEESEHLAPGTFCVDEYFESNTTGDQTTLFIVRSCRPRSICQRIPCVRRCCRNEQMLEKRDNITQCVEHEQNIRPIFYDVMLPLQADKQQAIVDPPEYGLINFLDCQRFVLSNEIPEDEHYLSYKDGRLHVASFDFPYDQDQYCVELVNKSGDVKPYTFACFPEEKTKFKYSAIGLWFSAGFLWITLIVYASLPKLLNLHGKTLVCYVISLLLAYMALAQAQFNTKSIGAYCSVLGYAIYFGFMAAFCWQTVMCFDIWRTFGSMRTSRGMRKNKELKRFLFYSLYAWGMSTALTVFTVLTDIYQPFPDGWNSYLVRENQCFFLRNTVDWQVMFIYFLVPLGLHIVINSVLFALTAIHCSKVQGDIHRMQRLNEQDLGNVKKRFFADKTKYITSMKLFIVMGVSWSLEVLSTIFQSPAELWYLSDGFNILQGLLVFLIFVFKWKVWHAIRQRLGLAPAKKKGSSQATATTNTNSKDGHIGKSISNSTLAASNVNLSTVIRN